MKLPKGLNAMSYRHILLTAAATSLALAACDQKSAGPVTGAPIASLPLAQSAPPAEAAAPYAEALPPAPTLRKASHPKNARAFSSPGEHYALDVRPVDGVHCSAG